VRWVRGGGLREGRFKGKASKPGCESGGIVIIGRKWSWFFRTVEALYEKPEWTIIKECME